MTDNTQYTDINRGNNDVTPEGVLAEQSEVLLDDSQRATGWHEDANQEWEEREARNELKQVAGLGELQDVTEVEYRKVRLERVVLVGVWSSAVTAPCIGGRRQSQGGGSHRGDSGHLRPARHLA